MEEISRKYQRWAKRMPELLLFPSDAHRDAAIKAMWLRSLRSWAFWRRAVLGVGIAYALTVPVALAAHKLGVVSPTLSGGLVGGVAGGLGVAAIGLLMQGVWRVFLRRRLIELGIPVCLKCGYDLRGDVSGRCPECGMLVGETPGLRS